MSKHSWEKFVTMHATYAKHEPLCICIFIYACACLCECHPCCNISLSHVMSYYMLHVIGICDEHFFASMFQSMDILHYVIHDTSPPQTFGGDSPQYRECFKMFEAIGFQYNHSVSQNICDVMDKRKDYHLRQCRILNPVVVDKAILRATLRRAETDRMNCMYSHPLYNQV